MFWSRKRVYADAAATTPQSARVIKELARLQAVFGNPGALYAEAVQAKQELETARENVAQVLGAHADEIVFTASGTEANNLALLGVLRLCKQSTTSVHAVTTAIEHPSVLEPLLSLSHDGVSVATLPVSSAGLVSAKDIGGAVTEATVLISIQFINSEIGTIQPIREIAKEIRTIRKARKEQGNTLPLYLHVDACQAPLWKTLQVENLGVDLLSIDGQKILGPKGVGALYIKRGVQVEAQILGGGQEEGRRSGTENLPLVGAFALALRDAQKNVDVSVKNVSVVKNYLVGLLMRAVPTCTINGAVGDQRVANNLNISIPGLDGEMCVISLDALGVAASTRSACESSSEAPSHVLTAIGLHPAQIKSAIRLTFLPSVTKKDSDIIVSALIETNKRYGQPIASK